jgi:hypothetical protein
MGRWAGMAVDQMLQGPARKGLGEVQTVAEAGAPTGEPAAAVPAGQ